MHGSSEQEGCVFELATDGERIIADTIGEGPTCLFVHGLGEGRYYWRSTINDARMIGRRLAYDLAGHGEAPHHPDGQYSLAKYEEHLVSLLDLIADVPVVIVGHSMGGEIALRAAAATGINLRGVVLVDSALRHDATVVENLRREVEMTDTGFATRANFSEWLDESRPLVTREMRAIIAQEALLSNSAGGFRLKRDPGVFRSRLEQPEEDQLNWDALAKVRCPILILRGEASSYLSEGTARAMKIHAQQASLKTVPRAGHGIPVENPNGFMSAIIPFLSSHLWNSFGSMQVRE